MGDAELYGDATPEDAWHPDDELDVLLDNLRRRADTLEPRGELAHRILVELEVRLERLRNRRAELDDVARTRVAMLAEDLAFIRRRVELEGGPDG